jgi:hypothetical protein
MQQNIEVPKNIKDKVVEHMTVRCESTSKSKATAQTTMCNKCPTNKRLHKSASGNTKKYWCQ